MRAFAYVIVFGVLTAITAAELAVIGLSLPIGLLVTTLMGSAAVKALLIALFFQHLKDEPRALSSILVLGLVAVVTLTTITILQLGQM